MERIHSLGSMNKPESQKILHTVGQFISRIKFDGTRGRLGVIINICTSPLGTMNINN